MQRAERYYTRFGVLTLLFARFIPVLRTVAGPLAGIGKMHRRTFMIYNAIGAIIWPVVVAGIGYFFGQLVPNLLLHHADHYYRCCAFIDCSSFHKYVSQVHEEKKAKHHSAENHTGEKGNE